MLHGGESRAGLERVRFFPRQLIGADDLTLEQHYFRERLRRHNRYLHGWGVACGCQVQAAPEADKPWQVRICPGYLLTPAGDEIRIADEARFDLATCMVHSDDPCAYARPCPPVPQAVGQERSKLYLAVGYLECQSRPVRVASAGCGCDDTECEYSRTIDAYEFFCLEQLPSGHGPSPYGCEALCQGGIFACPGHSGEPWVVLATIATPASAPTQIRDADISLADRRALYSTAMVQELALCGCGPSVPTTPTPLGCVEVVDIIVGLELTPEAHLAEAFARDDVAEVDRLVGDGVGVLGSVSFSAQGPADKAKFDAMVAKVSDLVTQRILGQGTVLWLDQDWPGRGDGETAARAMATRLLDDAALPANLRRPPRIVNFSGTCPTRLFVVSSLRPT